MNQLVVGSEVQKMFGSIARRYDRANTVLSLGVHHWWRWHFFRTLSAKPSGSALDLCTGTGDLLPQLATRYAQVIGVDFCAPMLIEGRLKWSELKNVSVLQGNGLQMPFKQQSFDLITVAFGVRNFEQLEVGLAEILRLLKSGGELRILEFGQPQGLLWGQLYNFYSDTIMPLIGGFLTGNRAAYTYLPKTSRLFPCREDFLSILKKVGFEDTFCTSLTGGIAYIYGAKKL
jgi:demethylmenaquinone methyltransferase / 2-methoxy-6-polyprenyl-1,4-benzoquinol methylase